MKACVMIPSYNTGPLLRSTVADALHEWADVFVIVDGSTDGSDIGLESLATGPQQRLRVYRLPRNRGKGAAFLAGIELAEAEGFTHALAMDSDGQHPATHIRAFIELGQKHPEALILGSPVFDDSAPSIRLKGRKISNGWVNFTTLWWGVQDCLFGMRLYPIEPLRKVFATTMGARRFDFDPECAARLCWRGVSVLNLPTPCRYLSKEEGGVSHFKYVRDNILLSWMHTRLFLGFLLRFPVLLIRKLSGGNPLGNCKL